MRLQQRETTFGVPAGALTAADRGRIMQRAHDYNLANRKPRQHNGPLTHACLLVLQALLFSFHHQRTGECFPSYEAIAAKSGVHRSTVAEAIKALETARILTWSHRIGRAWRRVRDAFTGKLEWMSIVVRRSNGYVFLAPPAPAKDTSSRAARRDAKPAASAQGSKSGSASGPNSDSFYNTKPIVPCPAPEMADGLQAALERLGSCFQVKAAPA